jgi:fumarate reductase subunit C
MSQGQSEVRVLPPHISTTWWLQKPSYFLFILREMSCVFVAWFVVYLLMLIQAVNQGDASYQVFLAWSASSSIVLLNGVGLLFLLFHAYTFFDAAPQAMVVKVGPNRVPGSAILAGHYAGLIAISLLVCWLLGVV